jgi:hypothetical protein
MLKSRFLSGVAQFIFLIFLLNLSPVGADFLSTCTGADPCYACKNCKYCRHCAKEGGRCGACK